MQNRRRLTTRETKVVELVTLGLTNAAIGREMGVSAATVKRYLSNIMIKWNCANRTQVAVKSAFPVREREMRRANLSLLAQHSTSDNASNAKQSENH